MLAALFVALYALCASVLAITVTTSTASYVVNAETSYGFTATISRTSCDITSLKFYGTEYQYSGTYSHIASGLGTATVSYTTSGQSCLTPLDFHGLLVLIIDQTSRLTL